MTIINWLNDNGVLISKNLADAMIAFEFKHNTTVNNKWVSELIEEVIKFTQKLLSDSENLRQNINKVEIIHEVILQLEPHSLLRMAIYRVFFELTDKVQDFQIGDETDNLIVELVRCTAKYYNNPPNDLLVFLLEQSEELTK